MQRSRSILDKEYDAFAFNNRYYNNVSLVRVKKDGILTDTYKLVTPKKCNFIRYGYDDDRNILYVDPEGGPFLHVEDHLPNEGDIRITEIYKEGDDTLLILELKNDLPSNEE